MSSLPFYVTFPLKTDFCEKNLKIILKYFWLKVSCIKKKYSPIFYPDSQIGWISSRLFQSIFMNVKLCIVVNHFFSDNLLSKRRQIRLSFLKPLEFNVGLLLSTNTLLRESLFILLTWIHHKPKNWKPDIQAIQAASTLFQEKLLENKYFLQTVWLVYIDCMVVKRSWLFSLQ